MFYCPSRRCRRTGLTYLIIISLTYGNYVMNDDIDDDDIGGDDDDDMMLMLII